MDRKHAYSARSCAPGVEIRDWANGTTSLRILFHYRGVRCRETIRLTATRQNINYAIRRRAEVLNAIERGMFNYFNFFPESKRAKLFGAKDRDNRCNNQCDITIGTLLNDYLQQVKRAFEASTAQAYESAYRAHLLPQFGQVKIRELTPLMLRRWLAGLQITAKTVSNILIPLRAVIDQALSDDLIDKDPLAHIKLAKILNKKTSRSTHQIDPFNQKEIAAILNTAQGQVKHLFQFAFFSGLRTSELIGLQWGDIDWVNGKVQVCRAVVCRQVKGTKTNAGKREVLLLPPALAALTAQKAYTFLSGHRVFHCPYTNKPWETSEQIRRSAWQPLLKKAGVRYRYPYQTRHTYASTLLSAGENMLWLANQMGHTDTEMIIKNYAKWLPDTQTNAGYQPVNDWALYDPLAQGEK